jgi:hypothetical protein
MVVGRLVSFRFLYSVGFPVREGALSRNRDDWGARSWCIEIHCGESVQLDYRNWPVDKQENKLDWPGSA